eukprot:5289730-Prymnesium_polylepis.1
MVYRLKPPCGRRARGTQLCCCVGWPQLPRGVRLYAWNRTPWRVARVLSPRSSGTRPLRRTGMRHAAKGWL